MADLRFIVFEILSVTLFCMCMHHALHRKNASLPSRWYVMELITAACFGILLEYVGTHFFHIYHYGQFTLNVLSVPVSVGLMWGVIIYVSMLTTDYWGIPLLAAPFSDVLQAIYIDLSIDIVAIRIGMWNWDVIPPQYQWTAEWFGVPYANFFGWILVVFLFSSIARLSRLLFNSRMISYLTLVCVAFTFILSCESIVFLALTFVTPNYYKPIVIGSLFFSACVSAWTMRWRLNAKTAPLIIAIVPTSIHLFFIALLFTDLHQINTKIVIIILLLFTGRLIIDFSFFRSAKYTK